MNDRPWKLREARLSAYMSRRMFGLFAPVILESANESSELLLALPNTMQELVEFLHRQLYRIDAQATGRRNIKSGTSYLPLRYVVWAKNPLVMNMAIPLATDLLNVGQRLEDVMKYVWGGDLILCESFENRQLLSQGGSISEDGAIFWSRVNQSENQLTHEEIECGEEDRNVTKDLKEVLIATLAFHIILCRTLR